MRTRVLAVVGLIGVVLAAYFLWARPYQLRWGATDEEVHRPMAGDELSDHPTFLATRAITIRGTPDEIWPWLMQMGYGRAGFYGYDILDNLGHPSANRILPQYQDFKVGDEVPISPVATVVFHDIMRPDYIVWSGKGGEGALTWALYPIDSQQTRLVSRIQWSHHWTQPGLLALDVFTEFTDHLAVRKLLQGVKDRVEGNITPESEINIEFFIYVGTFLAFIWVASSVLRLPLTWGSWLVGLGGGLSWLIAWYAPVSKWTGVLLCFLMVWAVRVEFRDLKRARMQAEAGAKKTTGRKR